ncbi:hypothetical protein GDO81_018996 [Engystomops pustulosus]|uniref:Uncharacterized protein n=1 Tax=Engystomops pustulosus TaxID=76066 RepID=A0AAV6YAI2_ENGPU|nr:hypothetical protein GDO81_018996 [Engystomops pustulosus]
MTPGCEGHMTDHVTLSRCSVSSIYKFKIKNDMGHKTIEINRYLYREARPLTAGPPPRTGVAPPLRPFIPVQTLNLANVRSATRSPVTSDTSLWDNPEQLRTRYRVAAVRGLTSRESIHWAAQTRRHDTDNPSPHHRDRPGATYTTNGVIQ